MSRVTLNRLESGTFPDLGAKKLQALLDHLGLSLAIRRAAKPRRPDFIRMASTTAGVSFKEPLTEEELILALLTGKVPAGKKPHFRVLLDEAPSRLIRGLLDEVRAWTKAGRVEKNLATIARDVGVTGRGREWMSAG